MVVTLVALGLVVYNNDREDRRHAELQAQNDLAQAEYASSVARYENARDERLRCEQRVQSHDDLRSVLIGLTVRLSDDGSDAESLVRGYLDDEFPSLHISDCPPVPRRPTLPLLEE